jgi:hypothetical protein
MTYYRGPDVEVFISTEDSGYGISQSADILSSVAWATDSSLIANYIVAPLTTDSAWVGTESDAVGTCPAHATAITDLEGVDTTTEKEREDIDFFGRNIQDHIKIRKRAEFTITKKMDSNAWALIYDQADAGVTGSGLNEATDQTETNSGYRVFVKVSSNTGSGHMWLTGRNMTYTTHKVTPTVARTTVEASTFAGNLYHAKYEPYITVSAATDL